MYFSSFILLFDRADLFLFYIEKGMMAFVRFLSLQCIYVTVMQKKLSLLRHITQLSPDTSTRKLGMAISHTAGNDK
jgi:hypothetical protein